MSNLVAIGPVVLEKMIMWKVYRQTDGRKDGRTDDGRQVSRKAHLSFQLRWAKNYTLEEKSWLEVKIFKLQRSNRIQSSLSYEIWLRRVLFSCQNRVIWKNIKLFIYSLDIVSLSFFTFSKTSVTNEEQHGKMKMNKVFLVTYEGQFFFSAEFLYTW